jgi:hypothetical protein
MAILKKPTGDTQPQTKEQFIEVFVSTQNEFERDVITT